MPYPMKPTELKRRAGNPGHRPLPDPILIGGRMDLADLLEPPDELPKDGQKLWRELAPQLIRAGVLDRADVNLFEDLCRAWARLKQFGRIVASEGVISMGSQGQFRTAPWVTAERAAAEEFRQLCARFGLSPVDRARLGLASLQRLSMAIELEKELAPGEGEPVDDDVIDGDEIGAGIPGL